MSQEPRKASNTQVLLFTVTLSFICALILSLMASALAEPIQIAKELDQNEQLLIAAKILTHNGYFIIEGKDGTYVPAKFSEGGVLVPGTTKDIPSRQQILDVYKIRIAAYLVDKKGELSTFEKLGINETKYLSDFRTSGYYKEPWMLIYKILPNPEAGKKVDAAAEKALGWVIPVNGFGLWDAIYGYLAVAPDGDTIIGISWYDQKETPGLGANIAEAEWQNQFPGKVIFQENPDGTTDFKTAPLGIVVVKGIVSQVLGDVPKAKSAVDGMAGATLTGNGVTDAYKDVLAPYRAFFITIHDKEGKNGSK